MKAHLQLRYDGTEYTLHIYSQNNKLRSKHHFTMAAEDTIALRELNLRNANFVFSSVPTSHTTVFKILPVSSWISTRWVRTKLLKKHIDFCMDIWGRTGLPTKPGNYYVRIYRLKGKT